MNFIQLYYLLSIDGVFIMLFIFSQFDSVQNKFAKYQKIRKERKSQTKPQPFSPGTSFFKHHHSLEAETLGDDQKLQRRKSKAKTLKLSQSTQNDQLKLTQVRKSIKNHTTLAISANQLPQEQKPQHRNTLRKQSQFVTNLIAASSTRNNINTVPSEFISPPSHKEDNQSDNKPMNPCFLYFPIIKGFIQVSYHEPIMLIQCWSRLLLQTIYVDLMIYLTFVFIPVLFIANRIIDKITRKIVNKQSRRVMFTVFGIYVIIILAAHATYFIFAQLNYLSFITNPIDLFGIDLLIYCIFRLYRVSESKEENT